MTNATVTGQDLETFVTSGFGADAARLELDCLASATCFDKSNDDEKARAKLAKKVLKKHASAPVLAALSIISRRNYLPKKHTTGSVFDKDCERLHDFEALARISGFDYIGFAARLVSIHPPLLIYLLSRRDPLFFKAYFEGGHPRDTLTLEDVDHPGGYRYDHVFSVAELKILATISRFTSLEFTTDAKTYPLPVDLSSWSNLESLTMHAKNVSSMSQARVDAIGALPKLKRLGLHMSLESLPGDLEPWSTLSSLDLSNNRLSELPDSFAALTELRELDLSDNYTLKAIRDGIGGLTNLEALNLNGTSLEVCSSRFGELTTLNSLSISQLEDTRDLFAVLGKLKALRHLRMSDMDHVTKLPDAIGELTELETLSVRDMDNVNEWFAGLGNLTKLVKLELYKLGWGTGPNCVIEGIGALENLEFLTFDETSLGEQFPNEVVHCTKLRELRLNQCYAGAPPEDIGKLTNLEVLDLRTTPLGAYPETFFELTKLKKLYLGGHNGHAPNPPNGIRNLRQLEYLDFDSARISALPDAFVELSNLKWLNLSFNKLKDFPPGFEKLTNLETVDGTGSASAELDPKLEELKEKMPWCNFWNFC